MIAARAHVGNTSGHTAQPVDSLTGNTWEHVISRMYVVSQLRNIWELWEHAFPCAPMFPCTTLRPSHRLTIAESLGQVSDRCQRSTSPIGNRHYFNVRAEFGQNRPQITRIQRNRSTHQILNPTLYASPPRYLVVRADSSCSRSKQANFTSRRAI